MFRIKFFPLGEKEKLTLSKKGESLIINEETFDFSQLSDGAILPAEAIENKWIGNEDITKENGVISIMLRYPLGANLPEEAWKIITVDVENDGEIEVPTYAPKEVKTNG